MLGNIFLHSQAWPPLHPGIVYALLRILPLQPRSILKVSIQQLPTVQSRSSKLCTENTRLQILQHKQYFYAVWTTCKLAGGGLLMQRCLPVDLKLCVHYTWLEGATKEKLHSCSIRRLYRSRKYNWACLGSTDHMFHSLAAHRGLHLLQTKLSWRSKFFL